MALYGLTCVQRHVLEDECPGVLGDGCEPVATSAQSRLGRLWGCINRQAPLRRCQDHYVIEPGPWTITRWDSDSW